MTDNVKVFWLEPTDQWVTRPRETPCCDDATCTGNTVNRVLYRRSDTGELLELRDAPVGAMYDASWYDHPEYKGPDGIALIVITPGGSWHVDGRASNCTMPDDHVHKCWVRHGDPRTGDVHVDKNGVTCAAGAGSILQGTRYHGFLHGGYLVRC